MNYRTLGRTGISVSEIGMGSEVLVHANKEDAKALIDFAVENGVNYFDLYNAEPQARENLGNAMRGHREKFVIQGHIGSAWVDGQYKRTRDIDLAKQAYAELFRLLETDYVDIGMIHYVDEQVDYDTVFGGELIEFAKQLKTDGKIRHIGMSTHNQKIALQAAKTGLIDVIMLSVNPAYDMLPPNEDVDILFEKDTFAPSALSNIDPARDELYRYCEEHGVALTVMKPYAGGALLDAGESPFGIAMTVPQCLHYCLTRPGVATVLAGAKSIEQLHDAIAYCALPDEQKEFATVLASAPAHSFSDKCMYCGHCAPCTMGIDIASVNKFADLCIAQNMVPETVREHYAALSAHASDCIACGACEPNCPFGVKIIDHMGRAAGIFGK